MASADDVCTAVTSSLPETCTCVAAGLVGGKVTCTESVDLGVTNGKFDATFVLDLKPCGSPASIEMTATVSGVDPITQTFEAAVDPGSITIPVGAAISVPGIDVLVGYDLKESEGNLAVKLTVDACFGVAPLPRACFSSLDFSTLPKTELCTAAYMLLNPGKAVACGESNFLSALNGGKIPVLPIKFPLQVLDTTIKTGFCTPPPGTCVETATPSVAADKTACDAVTALTDTTACSAVMTAAAATKAACTFTAAAPAAPAAPAPGVAGASSGASKAVGYAVAVLVCATAYPVLF